MLFSRLQYPDGDFGPWHLLGTITRVGEIPVSGPGSPYPEATPCIWTVVFCHSRSPRRYPGDMPFPFCFDPNSRCYQIVCPD